MNGILRLVWTYLYRCHEPGSTVTAKMEQVLRHFFPTNRLSVMHQDERTEPLIYLVHYILTRNFDYGSEVCLDLLQEKSINAQPSNVTTYLAPDRMWIAVHAILHSVRLLEKEEQAPAWPSNSDFMTIPDPQDYPTSSDALLAGVLKPSWSEFLDKCSAVLCTVATSCYQTVGKMSVMDDQWSSARWNPSYEESHNYIIRHHPEGSMAYPVSLAAQINVLQLCYQAWPRCLHSSLPLETALEMLIRGVLHVEPSVGEVAAAALERFTADFSLNCTLVSCLLSMIFDPQNIAMEGTGLRMMVESLQLMKLWCRVVERWTGHIAERRTDSFEAAEAELITSKVADMEAASLFMLSHMKRSVRAAGVKTLRLLGPIRKRVSALSSSTDRSYEPVALDLLLDSLPRLFVEGSDDAVNDQEQAHLEKWKDMTKSEALLDLAESRDPSDHASDHALWWKQVFPSVVQTLATQRATVISAFREQLASAVSRFHPFIVHLSGVGNRGPGVPPRSASISNRETSTLLTDHIVIVHQWHMWTTLMCITAQVVEVRSGQNTPARDHTRARSEMNIERDSLVSSRDLFKYLSPFLDCDATVFRDAAVSGISSLPAYGYSQLLEDLSILASRQLYDDLRSKGSSIPNQGRARRQARFHTAVARIYYRTAQNMQKQRSSGKQTALTHILKYIRNMQTYLSSPENRSLYSIQRLRRYFCGVLERFFDGLATLADFDRFVPPGMYLSLYRLCEEWCQLGKQSDDVKQRLIHMQTAAAQSFQDPAGQAAGIQKFQVETKNLSNAAAGAMASLIVRQFSALFS